MAEPAVRLSVRADFVGDDVQGLIQVKQLRLWADPSRVVLRPFQHAWQTSDGKQSRAQRIVESILAMDDHEVEGLLETLLRDFEARHWQTRRLFMERCAQVVALLRLDARHISDARRQLIGAHFYQEYSYAAAAVLNPSVVPHHDQSGLDGQAVRIILSMRAVGEGHTSMIMFREGMVTGSRDLILAPQPPFAEAAAAMGNPEPQGAVTVHRPRDYTLSGTVIAPVTAAQSNGLEDLRLLLFTHDDGSAEWIGTYTAYSRLEVRSELLRTRDFSAFELHPLTGSAVRSKGLALFPRKVNGRYMMIGRHDGENLFLLESETLTDWNDGRLLLEPLYHWEVVQVGNCGAPIELDEGWLLLTHGVGAMRKYSMGAVLLDKHDPSRVMARTREPILTALDQDREGYVPNVVYTCGAMRMGDDIFMPYGLADSTIAFGFISISDMLASLA